MRVPRLAVVAAVVTLAGVATTGALSAQGRGRPGTPWLLLETGPGARSLEILLAPGCTTDQPRVAVTETRSTIRIRVASPKPPIDPGCDYEPVVTLSRPIGGRRVVGSQWGRPLRFGLLSQWALGVPRVLGLAPDQAAELLWLYGFRTQVTGQGPQIVAQVPGWELTGGPRPDVITLVRGERIAIPSAPTPAPGAPAGRLLGAVRFVGGPYVLHRPPIAGVSDVFDAGGRFIAQARTTDGHYFRLRLAPGLYQLHNDSIRSEGCGSVEVRVRAGHTTCVTVPVGCDVP